LGGYRYGDAVVHVQRANALKGRDLHELADGSGLPVEWVLPAQEMEFMQRAVASDARILPIRRNALGRRERTWAEVSALLAQEDFGADWLLSGPRTTKWCVDFINREGLGPDGHHERFRMLCKLDSTTWGVSEHSMLTDLIKWLLLTDQLDATNLHTAEAIFRRLQTIEYSHQEKLREDANKNQSARLTVEEQAMFAGTVRAHTSLMVCPDLLEYVRKEVERDANLSKNLRKAREEREALSKKTKG